MAEEKIKVRIRPLHGIGGVGEAGDVVWMTPADAKSYFDEGYVEYVDDVIAEIPPAAPAPLPSASPQMEERNLGGEVEDHKIMKPQNKRARKK